MRRGNLIWGIIVLMAGVLLLLDNLGYLPRNAWSLIWPGALILLGLWFLFGSRIARGDAATQQLSIPLEAARQVDLTVQHGAGRLELTTLNTPGLLLEGSFENGVETHTRRDGENLKLKLDAPEGVFVPGVMMGGAGLGWRFALSPEPAYRLKFETGANEAILNLTDLRVIQLKVSTGASSTEITLPARAGFTNVKVEAGAASVKLYVPEGVAAQIRVEQGLSDVQIDPQRFPRQGDVYISPDYASAANRVDIHVETGVGSITIR